MANHAKELNDLVERFVESIVELTKREIIRALSPARIISLPLEAIAPRRAHEAIAPRRRTRRKR